MFSSFKTKQLNMKVNLGSHKEVEVDVLEQLRIDTSDLQNELLEQPARYALWATIHDLNTLKLEKLSEELLSAQGSTRYHDVLEQYLTVQQQQHLLTTIRNAFNHRKSTLLLLLNTPKNKEVLALYESHIRALEDTVPISPITREVI